MVNVPIFRCGQKIVYFAHVPKCGGTSVEKYISARFGPLAFWHHIGSSRRLTEHWFRSSPQHIEWSSAEKLFPVGFFDASFAIVRHPVARIVSVFCQNPKNLAAIKDPKAFSKWLRHVCDKRTEDPRFRDNHFRAQWEIVPPGSTVFKLEDGMSVVIRFLDQLAGDENGPREIAKLNSSVLVNSGQTVTPSNDDLRLIAKTYQRDFVEFDYEYPSASLDDEPGTHTGQTIRALTQTLRDSALARKIRLSLHRR